MFERSTGAQRATYVPMLSMRRGLVLFLLLLAGAVAILALPGPAHAAAGCDEQRLSRTFVP